MCANRPEFVEVLDAAQRIGLRLTPVNWHLTGEEAAYIVADCEAKAFVCSAELREAVTRAAEAARPRTGAHRRRGRHRRLRDRATP